MDELLEDVTLTEIQNLPEVETSGYNHTHIYVDFDKKRFYKIDRCPNAFSACMISRLRKKQLEVMYTQFPLGRIFDQQIYVGSNQVYFEGYKNFLSLYSHPDLFYQLGLFERLLRNLEELHKVGIHHQDLYDENILYKENQVQIVDWEGSYVLFSEGFNREEERKACLQLEWIFLQMVLQTTEYTTDLRERFLKHYSFFEHLYQNWVLNQYSFYGYYHLLEDIYTQQTCFLESSLKVKRI